MGGISIWGEGSDEGEWEGIPVIEFKPEGSERGRGEEIQILATL